MTAHRPVSTGNQRTYLMTSFISMGALCLCVGFMLPQAIGKPTRGSTPFDPLTPIYKQLTYVLENMMQGPIKSAKPFGLHSRFHKPSARSRRTYKQLALIASPQIGWLVFEFEMTLMDGKKPRHHIRWIVGLTKQGWRIAELRSYPSTSRRGVPSAQLAGVSLPMAKAAKQISAWLQSKQCRKLPILSPQEAPAFLPKELNSRMLRGLKKTHKRLRDLCKITEQIKFDNVMVYVDDIIGFVTNKKDQMKGAIKVEWRLQSKGELLIGPPRFRNFPRR